MRLLPSVLVLLALAGCIDQEAGSRELEYRFGGAFTAERDLDEFRARLAPHNVDVLLMESFPEQFSVTAADQATCEAARDSVADLPYLARLTPCEQAQRSAHPDAPDSNAASG